MKRFQWDEDEGGWCDSDGTIFERNEVLVRASDYDALCDLLKLVQSDRGNWLHSDLLDAIDKAVGESGAYRPLDDSGVPSQLEAAFAKEPERSIVDSALRRISDTEAKS